MRRNNPGLFNDGVFAKDSQFRSPAWVKAKESTRRRRENIKLATGTSGGGGAKPPKLPTSGRPFWEADPDDGSLPDAHIAPPGFRMPFTRKTRPRATYERAEHALSRHASDAVITSEVQTFSQQTLMTSKQSNMSWIGLPIWVNQSMRANDFILMLRFKAFIPML
ncbi:hypothetical protein [Trueperella abortisuis]|uniref:Uncharacterized protein n=1 Tax=Trueperella abortisuis TaxID=445930 RepID=A0ABT9PI66_9ACTO|nr:hypothetical protein [Trueperella abortisuis]MDP9832079.1 hypothetical protein [Trueperella abortisuis]